MQVTGVQSVRRRPCPPFRRPVPDIPVTPVPVASKAAPTTSPLHAPRPNGTSPGLLTPPFAAPQVIDCYSTRMPVGTAPPGSFTAPLAAFTPTDRNHSLLTSFIPPFLSAALEAARMTRTTTTDQLSERATVGPSAARPGPDPTEAGPRRAAGGIVPVLAFSGIVVAVMQTLLVPVIKDLPTLLDTAAGERHLGHDGDPARGRGHRPRSWAASVTSTASGGCCCPASP